MMMKIAVVTGASSGIGREFVRQMDRRYTGLDEIWVIARRKNRLDELKAVCGTKIRVLPLDLCEKESLDLLTRLLENKRPAVKLLVNASGYGKIGTVADLTADEPVSYTHLSLFWSLFRKRLFCFRCGRSVEGSGQQRQNEYRQINSCGNMIYRHKTDQKHGAGEIAERDQPLPFFFTDLAAFHQICGGLCAHRISAEQAYHNCIGAASALMELSLIHI